MPKKFFDDEFKAKKVWQDYLKRSKSATTFKIRQAKSSKQVSNNPFTPHNAEVVIRVTGSSCDFNRLKAHLRYISRNGELEVFDKDEMRSYQGKESFESIAQSFNEYYEIKSKKELECDDIKPKREALHIVFSMKHYHNATTEQIKKASINAIKQMYPHNHFVIAMHNDTDNPHCHLVLKMMGDDGVRINPNKAYLANMRELFARELRYMGVDAKATRKSRMFGELKLNGSENFGHKPHHYMVKDFGKANFNFNDENEMSYYVTYTTSKGKDITIWAKDLERVVNENNIQRGEYCRFAITDEVPRTITIKDKKQPNIVYSKVVYEKKWNVSVENRLERELNPLKRSSKSTYSTYDIQVQGQPTHTTQQAYQHTINTTQPQRKGFEW